MTYSFDSRVRYSEVGEDMKLTLPAIIDYFQDCSTFQSEDLGVGLKVLTEQNRAWIIAYWNIEVKRYPEMGEKVHVVTSPYEIKGFFGKRNFWMVDEAGEMTACADSLWIFLDSVSGKPVRVEDEIADLYGTAEPLPMEKFPRKINVPKDSLEMDPFSIVKSHLDTNHHVNNAQYIYMAEQYLPKDANVKRLRVEYKKSAVLNDVIYPLVSEKEDLVTISLCDKEKKAYAVLEFQIDKELQRKCLN